MSVISTQNETTELQNNLDNGLPDYASKNIFANDSTEAAIPDPGNGKC